MILLPQIIDRIISTAFCQNGVITINRLDEADFEKIPIIRQILCLCDFIHSEGGKLKLTPSGFLPLKVVKEVYLKGISEPFYDYYPIKRMTENDARFVRLTRDLASKSGILRKTNNALHITKKGEKLLMDKQQLLESLICDYVHKFDMRYYDGYRYEEEGLGYRDAGMSVLLFDSFVKQLGEISAMGSFYADDYFSILPWMYLDRKSETCYVFRTFQNFMEWFGMVTTKSAWNSEELKPIVTITPTDLYIKMIHIDDDINCIEVENDPGMKIYELKISLAESKPFIWRKIQVPSSLPLSDFHDIIQFAMGWKNAHLHEFEKDNVIFSDNNDAEELADILTIINYTDMKVSDLLKEKGDSIIYRYDFGDEWLHNIELNEVIIPKNGVKYPVIVDGERKCPPEDCGGIYGFYDMLQVLDDHDDPEREEYIEWLGGDFNAEEFDYSERNAFWLLKRSTEVFE